ncbi:MAG: PAS domain-containing protein [Rikenellaceae bacterium]
MKFFSINNKLCAKCTQCGKIYLVNAAENNTVIFKDGNIKSSSGEIDEAIEIGIPIEDTPEVEKLKKTNLELEQKLSAVLEENRILKERSFLLDQHRTAILEKIPYGIVIFNNNKRITYANSAFIHLVGYKAESLDLTHPHLNNVKISQVLCDTAFAYIESSLYSQDYNVDKTITVGKRKLSLSTYPITKADYAFAIVKDMYNEDIVKEEISSRIQEVLDQNMAMVQKIGFLMGEETSKTTKTLNSIISTLKEEER